jgi:triosephosphate isomerase
MSRTTTIIGNWKMNLDKEHIREFFLHLEETKFSTNVTAGFAPQAIHIPLVQTYANKFGLLVGSQDCSAEDSGAYTGEIATNALKDMEVDFSLVGHSERRTYHKETNELLNKKVKQVLKNGLRCIYCIGETLEERESEKTFDVLTAQVQEGLKEVSFENSDQLIVAYEPVWAIGTGKTATSDQAEEAHAHIRSQLAEIYGQETADRIVILYGGSVKPSNIKELLEKENVDGALVGGASLKPDSFSELCS